jgi:hypothetical protein
MTLWRAVEDVTIFPGDGSDPIEIRAGSWWRTPGPDVQLIRSRPELFALFTPDPEADGEQPLFGGDVL